MKVCHMDFLLDPSNNSTELMLHRLCTCCKKSILIVSNEFGTSHIGLI